MFIFIKFEFNLVGRHLVSVRTFGDIYDVICDDIL